MAFVEPICDSAAVGTAVVVDRYNFKVDWPVNMRINVSDLKMD